MEETSKSAMGSGSDSYAGATAAARTGESRRGRMREQRNRQFDILRGNA